MTIAEILRWADAIFCAIVLAFIAGNLIADYFGHPEEPR